MSPVQLDLLVTLGLSAGILAAAAASVAALPWSEDEVNRTAVSFGRARVALGALVGAEPASRQGARAARPLVPASLVPASLTSAPLADARVAPKAAA
jgi:hypothetical protein